MHSQHIRRGSFFELIDEAFQVMEAVKIMNLLGLNPVWRVNFREIVANSSSALGLAQEKLKIGLEVLKTRR